MALRTNTMIKARKFLKGEVCILSKMTVYPPIARPHHRAGVSQTSGIIPQTAVPYNGCCVSSLGPHRSSCPRVVVVGGVGQRGGGPASKNLRARSICDHFSLKQ